MNKLFMLLALQIFVTGLSTLLIPTGPLTPRVESQKLEISFGQKGGPIEIVTPHKVVALDAGTTRITVNGNDPYTSVVKRKRFIDGFTGDYEELNNGQGSNSNAGSNQGITAKVDALAVGVHSVDKIKKPDPQIPGASGEVKSAHMYSFNPKGYHQDIIHSGELYHPNGDVIRTFGHVSKGRFEDPKGEFSDHNSYDSHAELVGGAIGSLDHMGDHLEAAINGGHPDDPVLINPKVAGLIIKYIDSVQKGGPGTGTEVAEEDPDQAAKTARSDIKSLKDSSGHIREQMRSIEDQIDALRQELAVMKQAQEHEEAVKVEQQIVQLEKEEKALQVEETESESLELKEALEALREEKKKLEEEDADDEELARLDAEIGDHELQIAEFEEEIKKAKLDQIEQQVEKLEEERENLETEGASVVDLYEIAEQIMETKEQEIAIAKDHQVEEEISGDIEDLNEEIARLKEEDEDKNQHQIEELEKVEELLQQEEEKINNEDQEMLKKVEAQISKDHSDSAASGTGDSETDETSGSAASQSDSVGSGGEKINIDQDPSPETNSPNKKTAYDSDEDDNDGTPNMPAKYTELAELIKIADELEEETTNLYSVLPAGSADVPFNTEDNLDKLLNLFSELQTLDTSFEVSHASQKENLNHLYKRYKNFNTGFIHVLTFYDLAERYEEAKTGADGQNPKFALKEKYLVDETDIIGTMFEKLTHNTAQLKQLNKQVMVKFIEFKSEVAENQTLTDLEKAGIASRLAPNLIELRDSVHDSLENIGETLHRVEEKKVELEKMIESMLELEENQDSGDMVLGGSSGGRPAVYSLNKNIKKKHDYYWMDPEFKSMPNSGFIAQTLSLVLFIMLSL